jgi:hypothetical protein
MPAILLTVYNRKIFTMVSSRMQTLINTHTIFKEATVPTSLRLRSQTAYGAHIASFLTSKAMSLIGRYCSWNVKLLTPL